MQLSDFQLIEGLSLPPPRQLLPLPPESGNSTTSMESLLPPESGCSDVQPVWQAEDHCLQFLIHIKVSLFLSVPKWVGQSDNPYVGSQLNRGRITTTH